MPLLRKFVSRSERKCLDIQYCGKINFGKAVYG